MPGTNNGHGGIDGVIRAARREGYPPSLKISVLHKGREVYRETFGRDYKFWDVGSLTKILVTTPLLMMLAEDRRIDLNAEVAKYLPFLGDGRVGRIPIVRLLNHSSGLTWWKPYYQNLKGIPWEKREDELKRIFRREKVRPVKACVYSDLDFILLGWVAETLLGMSLDEAAETKIFRPLGLKNTFFVIHGDKGRAPKGAFAPTEKHTSRGQLQGVVFDDNAWSFGGVSGHAGLFSTLEDVSRAGLEFWKASRGKSKWIKASTFLKFSKRSTPKKLGDWALGFTVPSRPVSTGGAKVSTDAFGHTGFTGTSLWVDRKRDTVVTILSNRTYPTRKDERFKELRRNIHDEVWEMIDDRR